MAAAYTPSEPAIKGQAFSVQIVLVDFANPGSFKAAPTVSLGDFKCSGASAGGSPGALTNLTNLPVVDPAGSIWVNVQLTAAEMNFDQVFLQGIDGSATKEWADVAFCINTAGKYPATLAVGDIADNAITDAKVAADVTIASVTGSVGSVTGNVGGNVVGSVGSVVGGAGLDAAGVRDAIGLAAPNLDSQLGGIQADTNDLQDRLPADLTGAGNLKADVLAIDGSTTAATSQKSAALAVYVGSVTGAATVTTLIDSGLTQTETDHWKGRVVIFLTGTLKYQATAITAFDPATDQLTFQALTSAPSGGDVYCVV